VIKLSWQLEDRRSEVEILEHLRSRGITSVPHVVASGDLAEMKDGLHGKIQRIMALNPNTDNRIYRAIVMKPFLVHLTTIANWTKFYEMFRGLIEVHREVYIKAKILHRDINPENLMVKEANGTYAPYLIDFDFAKDVDRDVSGEHIRTHRTMSTPFIARELLAAQPPSALYRHDLESFVWCLWWIAVSYLNGEQIVTDTLNRWHEGRWHDLYHHKFAIMATSGLASTPLAKNMDPARPILERLLKLFWKAYNWLEEQGNTNLVDRESAGQIITWETFQACLATS